MKLKQQTKADDDIDDSMRRSKKLCFVILLVVFAGTLWGTFARAELEQSRSIASRYWRTVTFQPIESPLSREGNLALSNVALQDFQNIADAVSDRPLQKIKSFAIDDKNKLWINELSVDLSPFIDNQDTLRDLSCGSNQTAVFNNSRWDCGVVAGATTPVIQSMKLVGDLLVISEGVNIDLSKYMDNSDTLLTLSCISGQAAQWSGSSWQCANVGVNTDDQTLDLVGSNLSIINGNNVDLSGFLDNTDNQNLTFSSSTRLLSINDGTDADLSALIQGVQTNQGLQVDASDNFGLIMCGATQVLKYSGSQWDCAADANTDTNTTYTASNGLSLISSTDIELGGALEKATNIDITGFSLSFSGEELRIGSGGLIGLATGNGDIYVQNDAEIDGQLLVEGLSLLNGNVDIGDSITDTISVIGRIDTSILPLNDDNYDLGSSSLRWRDVYVGPASLHVGVDGDDATISYDTPTDTLSIDQSLAITNGGLSIANGSLSSPTTLTLQPAIGNGVSILLSGTGDFSVNTDDLFVDTSLGRVGIGTNSPSSGLEVIGGLTVSGTVIFNSSIIASDNVTVNSGHFLTTGTAPTVVANAAAGAGAIASATGTDVSGKASITTGTLGIGTGNLITITFNEAYTSAPNVVITPDSSLGAVLDYYVTATASGFSIGTAISPNSLTNYTFNYIVIH